MPMGANGRRNDGSIRPAEWRRNSSKNAAAQPKTRSHQPDTACRHWETYITWKNINNLHKINFYVVMKKINKLYWKNWHLIVGTTQYCDTQKTIYNTTNNTQHKIHSCYIISFETFFAFDCWHNTVHNTTQLAQQYMTLQTIYNTKYIVVI